MVYRQLGWRLLSLGQRVYLEHLYVMRLLSG